MYLAGSLVRRASMMVILGILAVGHVHYRILLFLLMLSAGCKWWHPT